MKNEYFIGLDIGTDSIGWAVTNMQYKIIKKSGKALWGVRLFPESVSAKDRRTFRIARRRYDRRKQRIHWLREAFSEEVAKVDPAFFQRLDESKFQPNDKRPYCDDMPLGKYTLFADKNYTDVEYHRQFPTIYHLRKTLISTDGPFDVRLVYLAIHHIFKKRGHFLFDGIDIRDVTFESCLNDLSNYLLDQFDKSFTLADPDGFCKALTDRNLTVSRKKELLKNAAGIIKKDPQYDAIITLLAGGSAKLSDLMQIQYDKDSNTSFSFKSNYEGKEEALTKTLEGDMSFIDCIRALYSWSVLDSIKDNESSISSAKVKLYNQHHDDLDALKKLLRPHRSAYQEMFGNISGKDNRDNYTAYTSHNSENHHCSYEKFHKFTKALLVQLEPELTEDEKAESLRIQDALDAETFLSRQIGSNNAAIPYQLNEQELKKILERASSYLPFLNDIDNSGLTLQQRIIEMFRFKIPYFVGPLYKIKDPEKSKAQNCWVVRTDEKITPWNFDKVVDKEATARRFITRMTATCTYLGKPVLPRDSLLYSKYVALNMLNTLCINDHPISVELKQRIYNDLLLKKYKCNMHSLKQFLLSNGFMEGNDSLAGIDDQFKISMGSYKDFHRLLSSGMGEDNVDDIIRHILLLGNDGKMLRHWLERQYGDRLSSDDINYVQGLKKHYSDWGNLSREFLTEIRHSDDQQSLSIIDALWTTNNNLMELLSSKYRFLDAIEAYRNNVLNANALTLSDYLKDSYAAPGIRRAIYQSINIISEIEQIMGGEPKRVFVEVTRNDGAKKRTISRHQKLIDLYKACQKQGFQFYCTDVHTRLQNESESSLQSDKLFLYYSQMGKCMYSGEAIDLDRLNIDYDIDHIYPQCYVKDDSIDNRVLVKRRLNHEKSNNYPLSDDIRHNMHDFWYALRNKNLITEEKFKRLIRSTHFEDSELSGFIARQLVETAQSAKIVAELLRRRYNDDRVVYVKAGNVSRFRTDQRIDFDGNPCMANLCKDKFAPQDPLFVKCRSVNDLHHAKDAYLNIVVGNVYHVKFGKNPLNFIKSGQTYSMNRIFDWDVMRNGEIAWQSGNDGSIAMVRQMMRKNNILFTRYAHEEKGQLFDVTLMPRGKGQAPIKSNDPRMTIEKYGGYNKLKGAYFIFVEHGSDKKRIRSIEAIYIMNKAAYEKNPLGYCKTVLALENPRILISRLLIDALISYNGFRMHLSGRTGSQIAYKNANQLILPPEQIQYANRLSKYVERRKDIASIPASITHEANCALYDLLLEKIHMRPYCIKLETPAKVLEEGHGKFYQLEISEQCTQLLQILSLFRANATLADLKLIGGSNNTGIIRMSKNLTSKNSDSFKLIHQSVTGFFEREVDLLNDSFDGDPS